MSCHADGSLEKDYLIKDCNNPILGTTIRFGIRFGIQWSTN
jgi:hypothetical protein